MKNDAAISDYLSRSRFPRIPSAPLVNSFPATMPLGQFLFEYLYSRGVRHSFGVPGDFALPTFTWLEKSKIQSVTMTHEPSAGFAADAYSRINGIGLVCVTYCVGGLNVLNATAGAYAEKSPVVVVGLNPIVIVLNNDGYGTMRQIRDGGFNKITQWNYAKICDLVGGGDSVTVSTKGEFDKALSAAQKSNQVYVIEVRIPRGEVSNQLAQIAREVRKVRGTDNSPIKS